ncbi:hypothetical protein GCM10009836_44020 [Pseudonocardia ailaonensis]|uniref:Thioesterase domain-containing protein n=1 Tax=Pseudonocardia ailaonensis TaxID=367279 RepID=A0ABN2N9G3_9PSEU
MRLPRRYQGGGGGAAHGGFIAAVLDEVSGLVAMTFGRLAVTKSLEIRFRRPMPVGVRLQVEAGVVGVSGREWWVDSRISDGDGADVASGSGVFVEPRTRGGRRSEPPRPA